MKKVIATLLSMGLILSLTACGDSGSGAPEQPASTSVSVSESVKDNGGSNEVSEPVAVSEESLINDFREAQAAWFLFESAMQTDSNDVKKADLNGYEMDFYRVTEQGAGSIQELTDLLSARVDRSFVETAISNDSKYKEIDGALYVCPAGRGDDMTMSWVEFAAQNDGASGKVIVTIHRQDFFDALSEWYETGALDTHEYPFNIVDGHAVFTTMEYLCGSYPEDKPEEGHDADSLEAALLGLLEGKWIFSDGSSYYEISADGGFTCYVNGEVTTSGYIVSSRSNDGSYMMGGEGFNNTFFVLTTDAEGLPAITFDEGATVYTKEGMG